MHDRILVRDMNAPKKMHHFMSKHDILLLLSKLKKGVANDCKSLKKLGGANRIIVHHHFFLKRLAHVVETHNHFILSKRNKTPKLFHQQIGFTGLIFGIPRNCFFELEMNTEFVFEDLVRKVNPVFDIFFPIWVVFENR